MQKLHSRSYSKAGLQRLIAGLLNRWDDKQYWISILNALSNNSSSGVIVEAELTQDPTTDYLYNGVVSGVMADGSVLNTTSNGELIIEFNRDDERVYRAAITLGGDLNDPNDWRYIGGIRSQSEFLAEIPPAFTGNIDAFVFNKFLWGALSGYVHDGYNNATGEVVTDLAIRFGVEDFDENADGFDREVLTSLIIAESTTRVNTVSYDETLDAFLFSTFDKNTAGIYEPGVSDPVIGVPVFRPLAGGNPLGTSTVPTGSVPVLGTGTVTADTSILERAQGAVWCKVQSRVNGYYPVVISTRTSLELYYATHNGGTSENTRANWDIESVAELNNISYPAIAPDEFVEYNGYPMVWYGNSLRVVYYDGAAWQEVEIIAALYTGINEVAFPALGQLVVSNFKGSSSEIDIVTYTGAATGVDRINPANYSKTHTCVDVAVGDSFGLCTIGLDGTYSFPIIWYCNYDTNEVRQLVRNAGVTGTPTDWDDTLMATIPASPTHTELKLWGMEHDATNNRVLIAAYNVGVIYAIDIATKVVTTVFGTTDDTTYLPAYKV